MNEALKEKKDLEIEQDKGVGFSNWLCEGQHTSYTVHTDYTKRQIIIDFSNVTFPIQVSGRIGSYAIRLLSLMHSIDVALRRAYQKDEGLEEYVPPKNQS